MSTETLNMKNTKTEMIEKYNKLAAEYKELSKKNINVKEIVEEKEKVAIVQSADEIVSMNILNDTIIKKYTDLNKAIDLKKEELKELFDLEAQSHSLIVLINSYNEKKSELESEYESKSKELQEKLEDKKLQVNKDIQRLEEERIEAINSLKKTRLREEDEYSYNISRQRKEENDKFTDDMALREKALALKESEFEERTNELIKQETLLNELKSKVEDIPNIIEKSKEEGALEKEKSLGKEYGYKKIMYEKEKEYEISSLKDKILLLEKELEKSISEKADLTSKLDNAYMEIRALATETVKSTGGVKILASNSSETNRK